MMCINSNSAVGGSALQCTRLFPPRLLFKCSFGYHGRVPRKTGYCSLQNSSIILCAAQVQFALQACKRESHTTFSHLQGREMSASLQEKSLACADTHDEFCLQVSSMFFWVKSTSLYINNKMMRPLKSRGCTLLASFIVVWTTWSSCIVVCPGIFSTPTQTGSPAIA